MQQKQMSFQNTLGVEQMMRCLSIFLICTLLVCLSTVQAETNNTAADQRNSFMKKPFTFFLNTATHSLNGTYLWENPEKTS